MPYIAIEKLKGWSIVADVFHGETAPIAVSIREAVKQVCPHIHRLVSQGAESESVGMELVCRVLFEFQQDYFAYLRLLAHGTTVAPPDFRGIVAKVESFRAHSLSTLPAGWYDLLQGRKGAGQETGARTPAAEAGNLRQLTGTVPTVNPRADLGLLQCFRECEHTTISAMIGSNTVEIPKMNGRDICLSWALKGTCSGNCKRKDQHKTYSHDTHNKLHALMTA